MKKYLLFIVTTFLLVFALTSCDNENIQNEVHEYTLKYDDTYHYDECDCGDIQNKEEHTYSNEPHVIQQESCDKEGIYEYTCTKCGYKKEVKVNKLNHEFGEWQEDTKATCLSKGKEKRVCKNCHLEEYRDTELAPHTEVAYTDVESDCTHEGHTGGTYCSVCREELTPYTTVDKKDHDYGEWITTLDPTCIAEGQAKRVCKNCNHEDYKTLEKTDHISVPGTAEASTCTKHGHTEGVYCSYCKVCLEEPEELELAEHEYTVETVTKEATYNSDGEKVIKCANCTASYTESIPRKNFICSMFDKCLTEDSIKNKTIEGTISVYNDESGINHYFDFTISNNGNIYYAKIFDSNTGKIFEYYTNKIDTISTLNDGFKHSKYHNIPQLSTLPVGVEPEEDHDENDMYYLLKKYIFNALYNMQNRGQYLFDEEHKYYYSSYSFDANNYKNECKQYSVSIAVKDDGSLKEFATMGDTWYFQVFSITDSTTITMPNAKYHSFIQNNSVSADGSINCECCDACFKLYQTSTDRLTLYYYQNIYDKDDIQFEYKLNNITEMIDKAFYDVTFIDPIYEEYTENGKNYSHFSSLYYEGSSARYVHPVESFNVNKNNVLEVTFDGVNKEYYMLLKDGSCVSCSKESKDSNSTSNYLGKYFDLIDGDNVRRYYIKSANTLEIYDYKEINTYFIDDKVISNFNSRKLFNMFGRTYSSWNKTGVKPDGSNDYIYFDLDDELNLTIYYTGIASSMKAFNTVTFQSIEGYATSSYSNFRIYFRGDNVDYVMEYKNRNITISYA